MNVLKSITVITALLILTMPLSAQEDQRMRRGQNVKHMSEELDLSDDQKSQVKEIMKSSRKSRKENLETSNAEVESQIKEVLTPEQIIIFDEMKVEREEKKAKRKEAHEAVENFKETNVKPFILQKRMELEAVLTTEEKALLSSIRSSKPDMLERESRRGSEKKGKSQRLTKENRQSLKALNEKYAEDINRLQGEIEANQDSWNEEIERIRETYKYDDGIQSNESKVREGRLGKDRSEKRGEKGHMKSVRFLLMDVDK